MNNCMFSSQKEDWETPQELFDQLNQEFNFTVDVASNEENRKCERYYTKLENGLLQNWNGEVVWCNPPYGRNVGDWVRKAGESNATVVMILPVRTDTKWFHSYIYQKAEIRFLKGRLKFGDSKNSAPFPSMVVVFRRKRSEKQC